MGTDLDGVRYLGVVGQGTQNKVIGAPIGLRNCIYIGASRINSMIDH